MGRKKKDSKKDVDRLFSAMAGMRFESYREMERWFQRHLKGDYPQLSICECDGVNSEIECGKTDVDFSTDCTFGENLFGFGYADFTVDYIKDNAGKMYVTFARWNEPCT